jgi:hypothetical protein
MDAQRRAGSDDTDEALLLARLDRQFQIQGRISSGCSAIMLDMLRFSGEALDQLVAIFSNWAGLLKSSAEWRRMGL